MLLEYYTRRKQKAMILDNDVEKHKRQYDNARSAANAAYRELRKYCRKLLKDCAKEGLLTPWEYVKDAYNITGTGLNIMLNTITCNIRISDDSEKLWSCDIEKFKDSSEWASLSDADKSAVNKVLDFMSI